MLVVTQILVSGVNVELWNKIMKLEVEFKLSKAEETTAS